jgi:flagellar basal-body rod protein FlgC
MEPMQGIFQGFDISAAGLRAELQRSEVVSANLGNMHIVGGRTREPYRRKTVVFEEVLQRVGGSLGELPGASKLAGGVRVREVVEDRMTPFVPRHMPQHPEANEAGYVLMSNVDLFQELVDVAAIERGFEANLATMKAYRSMLQAAVQHLRS